MSAFSKSLISRLVHHVQRPSPITNHTTQTEVRRPKLSRHTFIRIPFPLYHTTPPNLILDIHTQPTSTNLTRTVIPKQKPGPTFKIQETHKSNPTTTTTTYTALNSPCSTTGVVAISFRSANGLSSSSSLSSSE